MREGERDREGEKEGEIQLTRKRERHSEGGRKEVSAVRLCAQKDRALCSAQHAQPRSLAHTHTHMLIIPQ